MTLNFNSLPPLVAIGLATALVGAPPAQAQKIGVASSVKNDASAALGGRTRTLASGASIAAQERIATGADSAAQLVFLDRSTVTLGPNAALTLNKFVYDTNRGAADVAVRATKGAFRFVSGLGGSENYEISTPRATIGIRGTIVEGGVDAATGEEAVVLVQGAAAICPDGEKHAGCLSLDQPGTFAYRSPDGVWSEPAIWCGPTLSQDATLDLVALARMNCRGPEGPRRTDRTRRSGGGDALAEPPRMEPEPRPHPPPPPPTPPKQKRYR